MKTLYHSLIHSHFSYGLLVWGNASKSIIHSSKILQKRAMRIICNAKYNSRTDPLFKSCGILKLEDLYLQQSLLFVFDFLSNNLPVSFTDMFKFNRDMPDARITRQSDLLHIDRCQSKFASSLPLYSLPIVWNRWVFVVSNPMSKIQFKTKIKLACINKYLSHVICNYRRCPDCYPSTSTTAN